MFALANCIATEHDLSLVIVAVAICGIGASVTARLLQRSMISRGRTRFAWNFIGAVAAGSTIWCTHFVAMLGYQPGMPVAYEPVLTVISLITAVTGCAAAFAIASERFRFAPELGGAAFGISIAIMHYCGMAAFATNGLIEWNIGFVVASAILGVGFAVLAFNRIGRTRTSRAAWAGALLIALAIGSLHFTGMTAVTIIPFPAAPGLVIDDAARGLLAFAVTGIGLLVLGSGAVSYILDDQAQARSAARLRYLAESAVDGLAVTRGGAIVETNSEFERMVQLSRHKLAGKSMAALLDVSGPLPDGKLISAQLRATDGSMLPVELAVRAEPSAADDLPLTIYALRDISQRLAQEQRISFLAQFDSLTGLRNRASFVEMAAGILNWHGDQSRFAVFAIDLDRFKEINDIHGHAAGDKVLRTVGRRLKEQLGTAQIGARLGGDEFVVFSEIHTRDDALDLAERLAGAFSADIDFDGVKLRCAASIGIALYPANGAELNDLLNNADLAMYRAKSSDSPQPCLYDEAMDDAVRARRKLIEQLRLAIIREEFELHYQAQVYVPGEAIAGYEALVRWNHPEKGLITPDAFIPLAEQTGLIVKLGEWVLRTACEEAAGWEDELPVSVNLSAAQLNDPNLLQFLEGVLRKTGIAPERLEFEVTETCFIADPARAVAVLEHIKALGISVSMDDFGTGYSSLAMLQAFPFDKIKIDKALVGDINSNPKSRGIFRAALSLGDALSIPILAEGVETLEQLNYLRAEGCQLVQGYIYGEPARRPGHNAETSRGAKSVAAIRRFTPLRAVP